MSSGWFGGSGLFRRQKCLVLGKEVFHVRVGVRWFLTTPN